MLTTRNTLERVAAQVEDSLGHREQEHRPKLTPVPHPKDVGRRPLRSFARIDIGMVLADRNQPREEFAEEAIERLAKSISEKGQLSPIRVRWSDELAKWVIIAGERRWRAAQRARVPTIDCWCHEADLTESEILEQQLIENCLREDLQPVEEARAFARIMRINGWNGKQLAQALHVPAAKVSRALALLKLSTDIQQQVDAGRIAARSAYELSKLKDDQPRLELARMAASGALTHDQTTTLVRQRRGTQSRRGKTRQVFCTSHGWRVTVSANKRGTYDDIELALTETLTEVQHRIKNGMQLF